MTWNEPGADPLADIEAWKSAGRADLQPNRIILAPKTYVAIKMSFMDFGWWPLSIWRRWRTRRRLLAEMAAAMAEE